MGYELDKNWISIDVNFYEKAHFVKVDVVASERGRAKWILPFAVCFYPL